MTRILLAGTPASPALATRALDATLRRFPEFTPIVGPLGSHRVIEAWRVANRLGARGYRDTAEAIRDGGGAAAVLFGEAVGLEGACRVWGLVVWCPERADGQEGKEAA